MLTIKDLDEIEKLIDEKLEERLKYLPTKDEFYKAMDELMGEIKAVRQELTIGAGQNRRRDDTLDNHEVRIKTLEKQSGLIPSIA